MSRWVLALALCAAPAAFAAVRFVDDFSRPDGPLTEWFQSVPTARIESGRLVLAPNPLDAQQPNAWAGKNGVPLFFGAMRSVACTVEFGPAPPDVVGRHGGLIFCGSTATHRYDTTFSGYFADWIDRVEDHGFRVFRVDRGVHTILSQGTPQLAEPPGEWLFEFTDTGFTLTADGELIFDIYDTTYRGGYFGCWCYLNAGQRMYIDDMVMELDAGSCPMLLPAAVRPRLGDPDVELLVTAPFGANDAGPYRVTVTSGDPAVVVVNGGVSADIVFERGGVLAKSCTLGARALGATELSIAANGAPCDASAVSVEVIGASTTSFREDFSGEADGDPEDCIVAAPTVKVSGEQLYLAATAGVEPHAWLGYQGGPLEFSEIARINFTIRWGPAASVPILRHGGVVFCAQAPASRWNNPDYTIDYLERDATFRIGRGRADGTQSWLAIVGNRRDPGRHWTVELTGATITFIVDGERIAEVVDTDLRSGYVGFWCYSNAGQEMFVDDIEVIFAGACESIAPRFAAVRPWWTMPVYTVMIPFGANAVQDYTVTVKSTRPDIATPVGADASGSLALLFPAGGGLKQTFDIECLDVPGTARLNVAGGNPACGDVFAEIEVLPEGAKTFSDDFEQADGPPENWTVAFPDWQVTDGRLANVPTLAAEEWIWAGNPPLWFELVERIAGTFGFDAAPPDDVGRHGGIMFYAQAPTRRGLTSGYELDWIDRATDRGYRLLRFDNGVEAATLAGPTFDLFPGPGSEWELTFGGDEIQFAVDGQLVFSAYDSTYRDGYLGAWVYNNGTLMTLDDVVVGEGDMPPGTKFVRGDVNADGKINIADAITALGFLFSQGKIVCVDAADVNDDGKVNVADPITLLQYQFAGGKPPPPPFDACGYDQNLEAPELGCVSFPPCAR